MVHGFPAYFSANVLRLPLSGSDHIPLPPSEYEGSDELGDEAEENFQEQREFLQRS